MFKTAVFYLLVVILVANASFLRCIAQPVARFTPVAPEQLSGTTVRCIYKDARGFIWFGTGTGLIRFDGTNVHHYEHTTGDQTTIPDNSINSIFQDAQQKLWIGTAQGLAIYDAEKDNFIDVDLLPENVNHLSSRYITALCADDKGRMWIGTLGQGLSIYDPSTFKFSYVTETNIATKVSHGNYVTSLFIKDNTVWVGTKGGLRLYNTSDFRAQPVPYNRGISSKEVTQVIGDPLGNIWVSTKDREVTKLTPTEGNYHVETTVVQDRTLSDSEGNILSLCADARSNIWISGENLGLLYLDGTSGKVIRYEAVEDDPKKLPTNSIRSVYIDDTGITWIGTYNKGAYMIDNRAKRFDTYGKMDFTRAGFTGYNVRGLAEDADGNIWISCDGGGLGLLAAGREEIRYDKAINEKISTKYLSALFIDEEENLWIGSWGRGVFRLNLRTRNVSNYELVSRGFGDNKVFSIYQDSRKRVWVGSAGSGLFYFEPGTDRFVPLNEETKSDYIRKTAYVTSIVEDSDSSLWIGTLFNLYRFNYRHDNNYNVSLYQKENQAGGLGSYDIQTLYRDNGNNLWVGTGDNGVAMLPNRGATFRNILKKDGLISNSIRGILADTRGNLWISSSTGLSKYNSEINSFRNYTKDDGLLTNKFNGNACLAAHDGKFFFGSDNGLVAFYPDSISDNMVTPVAYFTDLRLNNQSVAIGAEGSPLEKHISLTTEINLPYSQRSFAIDFAAINYSQSSGNRYCYKLEGFDDDWNCTGSDNRGTYTNIDPGKYVFLVVATNSDGISSKVPARIDIIIHQAPWKTWWAILLYLALISSLIAFLLRLRIERIKIKNQLNYERLARENEHALIESKTQFFTNISHEFRTPLSLITMPLENLMAMSDLPVDVKERLGTIRTSAEKMTRLVNELMDFNKLENAKLELHIQEGELVGFISEVASIFHDVAIKKKIHFGIHAMVHSLCGWFDKDKMEKILFNIISNAFKFTPDSGQINIIINVKNPSADDDQNQTRYLDLVIVDNGIGISAEELPFIFDKFYQAKSGLGVSNPGTGIGLSLTKGLVELHRGTIKVESTPGRETKFAIQLPIDRQAYDDNGVYESSGYITTAGKAAPRELDPLEVAGSHEEEIHDKAVILLAEDNDELRNYLSLELRNQFIVLEAKDGKEALEIAFEKSPDLIVSDIIMPLTTGVELCNEIKTNLKTSHIPFILLTAKASVDDQIAGIASGADVYVTKPFSMRFLVAQVNQIIESRKALYARFSQDVYLLPGKATTNALDQAFLQKVIDYIIDNIQSPQLGVDSIADLCHLGRMQTYRKIKALTGKSVVEFIRMVRIKQALKLIETHKYTLSEVAYLSGFNSSSYFTRVFREEYGKTPSEYLGQF